MIHMKALLLYLGMFSFFGFSQNLVSNHSFENYSDCPESSDEVYLADGWQKLAYTSDYYNCEHFSSDIDTIGQNGSGYMGMSCLRPNWDTDYREYVGQYLDQPLVGGTEYYVEFWVKLSGDKCIGTDAFGALFTIDEPQPVDSWTSLLPYFPQIENEQYNQIDNCWEWKKICGTFVAEGGENFITLGSFKSDLESTYNVVDTATCKGGEDVHWSYILVDNVLVTSSIPGSLNCIDGPFSYPETAIDPYDENNNNSPEVNYANCVLIEENVITPNGDQINDYLLINVSANFYFKLINRWGDMVYYTDQMDVWYGEDLKNRNLSSGTYFFLVVDHINSCRQQGTITILR